MLPPDKPTRLASHNFAVETMLTNERNFPMRHDTAKPSTFTIRNLSVLAYANGFTLWHYKAGKERLEMVAKQNFFADVSDMLAVGDMIMVTATDGARIMCVATSGLESVTTVGLV